MANRVSGACSAMDKRTGHTGFAQNHCRLIHGVAFSDCAEVEHDSFASKSDCACGGIKSDVTHTDYFPCSSDFLRRRHFPSSTHESPTSHERGNGNIERAARYLGKILSLL